MGSGRHINRGTASTVWVGAIAALLCSSGLADAQPAEQRREPTLKTELDTRRALVARQEHVRVIAERVRTRLKRGALRQAAAELAYGRAQYPDEELWGTLQNEIDAG